MLDFNQAIILGNVTRDLELRYTPNNQAVVSFSVATNRRWTNRETQQPQEEVEFHNVVAWGKLAEICNQILYKGRKVLVAGRLRTRNWEGQDGVKRYTTEIIADHISATGVPKSPGEAQIETPTQKSAKVVPTSQQNIGKKEPYVAEAMPGKEKAKENEEINLDDIPF